MSDLADKIRSRGYWHVIIRPRQFIANRIPNLLDLEPLVYRSRVSLRGWDYPHMNRKVRPELLLDSVTEAVDWEHYVAIWRLYQSGMFVHLHGIMDDWRDQSSPWPAQTGWQHGAALGTGNTVWLLTEILEFATRLAASDAGADDMHLEITVRGLNNRRLYGDDPRRGPLFTAQPASIANFPYKIDLAREELLATRRHLALDVAQKLFRYFAWDASLDILRDIQGELLERR